MFDTLTSLLQDQVQDLFNAENQLLQALPLMAKAATNPSLQKAFTEHRVQTATHIERLRAIGATLAFSPEGKVCKAMKGLIAEGNEVLEQKENPLVVDAALIGVARRIEHYEIAAYDTAHALAPQLEQKEIAELLHATLEEEAETDERLTVISDEVLTECAEGTVEREGSGLAIPRLTSAESVATRA